MVTFRTALEEFTPKAVTLAWDYVQRDDRVETLWVYVTVEAGVSVYDAFYRIGDSILEPQKAPQALGFDGDINDLVEPFYDDLGEAVDELVDAVGVEDVPTRMVLRFRTADQDYVGDFSYAPLQPHVPDSDQVSDSEVADRWLERLRRTGNDSATL